LLFSAAILMANKGRVPHAIRIRAGHVAVHVSRHAYYGKSNHTPYSRTNSVTQLTNHYTLRAFRERLNSYNGYLVFCAAYCAVLGRDRGLGPQLDKPGAYIRAGYTGSGCGEVARFRAADSGFL
jgi:hypothetical protein